MLIDVFRTYEFLTAIKIVACLLPVLLLSLTMHEWGHAYAAHLCGDDTAKNLGRMTLNPIAHIDPFGFLMLLVAYFGWAKPVPVNPRNYRNYKQGEAIVSLAGVTMNLLLAIIFSIAFVPVYRWVDNYLIRFIIEYGISLNIILMLFNLLPIYPLDGYHIFELLFARRLPMRVFLFLRRYGQYILIAILILCRVTGFHPISQLTTWVIGKLIALAFTIG